MEKEILLQILANQVLIYRRIDTIERVVTHASSLSASMDTYHHDMIEKTKELMGKLKTPK